MKAQAGEEVNVTILDPGLRVGRKLCPGSVITPLGRKEAIASPETAETPGELGKEGVSLRGGTPVRRGGWVWPGVQPSSARHCCHLATSHLGKGAIGVSTSWGRWEISVSSCRTAPRTLGCRSLDAAAV